MQQLNCYGFFASGMVLQNCYNSALLPLKIWIQAPINAKNALETVLRGDGGFKLDESRAAAEALLPILDEIIAAHAADPESQLHQEQVNRFNLALFRFDAAFQLELGRAPIFYVTAKGVFDTRRLIDNADAIFEGFEDRLPKEALADTKEAGRCLAFSLFTAAGFHIARATEAVIKQYMAAYGCEPVKDGQRNWGYYAKTLEAARANKVIIHHIDQLRELHRNPIAHPEATLSQAEAVALHAMCQSLIQAMVGDMENRSSTPNLGIAGMLPVPSDNGQVTLSLPPSNE